MEVTKKKEQEAQGQEGKKPEIDPAIIEELTKGYQRPEDLTGPGGIMEPVQFLPQSSADVLRIAGPLAPI